MVMGLGDCECPHCKCLIVIDEPMGDSDSIEIECGHCEKTVVVTASITTSYKAKCVDGEHVYHEGEFRDGKKYKECSRCGDLKMIRDS